MRSASLTNPTAWSSDEIPVNAINAEYPRVNTLRKIVLWSVGGYLILNAGFELIRFPPIGPGIPIGEFVLVICLLIISAPVLLPRMASEVWIFPIIIWWCMSLSRSLFDTTVGGPWAFRDASQAIESLYLIVGFWLVRSPGNLAYFFSWLKKLLVVGMIYGLTYPISSTLQAYSPKLSGVASGASSIFFEMGDMPVMLLWGASWLLIDRQPGSKWKQNRDILAGCLVGFAVAFAQAKTVYLQVLIVGGVLFLVRRKVAAKWVLTLFLGILIIGLISASGIEIKGRLGEKISLDFITRHFESLSGSGSGSQGAETSAEGIPQRIGWWRHILEEMEESPQKMIFGLGYGQPLTSFHSNKGAPVREPHNSLVSVGGRLGIFGLIVWLLMQVALYSSWWRSFRITIRMQWTEDQNNLLLLFIFSLLVLAEAIGETGFEAPFFAIPYYLFFGVVLRYGRHLRQAAAGQQVPRFG